MCTTRTVASVHSAMSNCNESHVSEAYCMLRATQRTDAHKQTSYHQAQKPCMIDRRLVENGTHLKAARHAHLLQKQKHTSLDLSSARCLLAAKEYRFNSCLCNFSACSSARICNAWAAGSCSHMSRNNSAVSIVMGVPLTHWML